MADREATGGFQKRTEKRSLSPDSEFITIEGATMTLTVKEKEHWKTSIDRKVQRAIDAIYAEGEPSFRDRILKESRRKALQSLGIEELQNRNIAISDQLRALQEEQRELEKKLADAVKARCSEYKVEYSYQFSVEAAISRRQKRFEQELLTENELGAENTPTAG